MKYNVKIIVENQEGVLEDTDFYAIYLTSEDSKFKMMCYGTRGTHIKV